MNENFKTVLNNSGLSMYALSAKARVPYTTINKIVNNKLDINKISSEAIARVSIVLKTDIPSLMNPFDFLNEATGRCGRIKYGWLSEPGQNTKIRFQYNGESVTLDMEDRFDEKKNREYYDLFAQMAIERYIKRKKFESEIEPYL